MSYAVSQRRREIAIRMALGAQRADVFTMVVGDGIVAAVAGVLMGLVAAFALTRLFTNLLYGIAPTDPRSFALGSVWVVTFMMLAGYLPTRRALKVDPRYRVARRLVQMARTPFTLDRRARTAWAHTSTEEGSSRCAGHRQRRAADT